MQTPRPAQIAHARRVVTNPARYTPRIRHLAWMLLKTAQGHPVRQSNLPSVPAQDRDRHVGQLDAGITQTPMTLVLQRLARARENRRALLNLPTGDDAA